MAVEVRRGMVRRDKARWGLDSSNEVQQMICAHDMTPETCVLCLRKEIERIVMLWKAEKDAMVLQVRDRERDMTELHGCVLRLQGKIDRFRETLEHIAECKSPDNECPRAWAKAALKDECTEKQNAEKLADIWENEGPKLEDHHAEKRNDECGSTMSIANGVGHGYPIRCTNQKDHAGPHRNPTMDSEWGS